MPGFKIRNRRIKVEIADTFWRHIRGLSFSKKRKNMLFVMPYESRWSFWMFGVKYPLYITFLDNNKKPVETVYAEPLTLNPKTWKIYKPKKKCKYILETYNKI